MVLKEDQERVRMLIQDTISLLCKNGLTYKNQFEIKALIGITLDQDDVFLIDINEKVQTEKPPEPEAQTKTNEQSKSKQQKEKPSTSEQSENSTKSFSVRKAERKRQREVETIDLDDSTDDSSLTEPHSNANQSINPAHRGSTHNPPPAKSSKTDDREIVQIKAEPDSYEEAAGYSGWNESAGPDDLSLSDSLMSPKGEHKGRSPVSWSQWQHSGVLHQPTAAQIKARGMRYLTAAQGAAHGQPLSSYSDQPLVSYSDQPMLHPDQQLHHTTGRKVFKCSHCAKELLTRTGLVVHENLHKGVYRYRCPFCKKGFVSSTRLRQHVKRHTEVTDLKCGKCGEVYTEQDVYLEHCVLCNGRPSKGAGSNILGPANSPLPLERIGADLNSDNSQSSFPETAAKDAATQEDDN